MSNCKIILLLPIVFACSLTYGQTRQDSVSKYLLMAQSPKANTKPFINALTDVPLVLAADSLSTVINDTTSRAVLNEQLGHFYYNKDADKSINYTKIAYTLYLQMANKKAAALCLNNIAFAYEEGKNIPQAIEYSRQAIQARKELADTLGEANMYKYLAMLQGKAHEFATAKQSAATAISLFGMKRYKPGIAVSYRDLANVYEDEMQYDSSIAFLLRAKEIWLELQNQPSRVYNLNNELMRVYTTTGRLKDAALVYRENEIAGTEKIYYSDVLNYYKYGASLWAKEKDMNVAAQLSAKYTTMKDSLMAKDIKVD